MTQYTMANKLPFKNIQYPLAVVFHRYTGAFIAKYCLTRFAPVYLRYAITLRSMYQSQGVVLSRILCLYVRLVSFLFFKSDRAYNSFLLRHVVPRFRNEFGMTRNEKQSRSGIFYDSFCRLAPVCFFYKFSVGCPLLLNVLTDGQPERRGTFDYSPAPTNFSKGVL